MHTFPQAASLSNTARAKTLPPTNIFPVKLATHYLKLSLARVHVCLRVSMALISCRTPVRVYVFLRQRRKAYRQKGAGLTLKLGLDAKQCIIPYTCALRSVLNNGLYALCSAR